MRERIIILIVIAAIAFQVSSLVGTDWRDQTSIRNIDNPIEEMAKKMMMLGSTIPGVRLMYPTEKGFPLDELTYWDTFLGCTLYSLSFMLLLWLTTPLPDIKVNFMLLVIFDSRTPGPEDEVRQVIHLPLWPPEGGEGPVFHNHPNLHHP
ncbi:uncharacterized protein NPIL_71271 [Nephila pilipes]|uniref:Uncharacterized protein n=1 Tax=Nephila pilipes TaxID=299642 RepID=A0A8X6NPR4_NEPPI|nr:uncharacterized protein NPIL_71271 [Nephila pilipes]